jgi:pimeloyl-ACP methyl ester carboxylesterase
MILSVFMTIAMAANVSLHNPYSGDFSVEVKGRGDTAVIFIHDYASDKRNFGFLSRKLASRKLRTVNVDLSGHGKRSNDETDVPFMHLDIRTVFQHLQKQGVRDIQCVGEGFGGIICLQALSADVQFSQVAIISPVGLLHHQNLFAHVQEYKSHRPLFLIVSDQDAHGLRTTLRLEERTDVVIFEVTSTVRGVSILVEHPEMERELVKWITRAPDFRGTWDILPLIRPEASWFKYRKRE